MPLQASISEVPGVSQSTYVELEGEFEGASVTNFSTFWNKQVNQDRRAFFILEMSKLNSCSNEAIETLRLFNDAVAEIKGGLAIVKPSAAVVNAMRSTGLGSLFTIFLQYAQAFEYLRELKAQQRAREERTAADGVAEASEVTRLDGAVAPPLTTTPKSMQRLAQGTAHRRRDTPPAPASSPSQYRLRGYTGDGRTFQGGAGGQVEPLTVPVLLAIPDSREYLGLRTFVIERLEAYNLGYEFVSSLSPDGSGLPWLAEGFRHALAFVGEVTPVPATREPTVGVAVPAALARLNLDPASILLLTSVTATPHPILGNLPHTLYKSTRQGLEQLRPLVDGVLQRAAADAAS